MPTDLNTRKPVAEITWEDLQKYLIWEYAIDEEGVEGQDETWIRPVNQKTVPEEAYSQIVAARFTTRRGRQLDGFMVVTTAAGDYKGIQPGAIVGEHGYWSLPSVSREEAAGQGLTWSNMARDDLVRALASEESDVLPMCYKLNVMLSGEKVLREGYIA